MNNEEQALNLNIANSFEDFQLNRFQNLRLGQLVSKHNKCIVISDSHSVFFKDASKYFDRNLIINLTSIDPKFGVEDYISAQDKRILTPSKSKLGLFIEIPISHDNDEHIIEIAKLANRFTHISVFIHCSITYLKYHISLKRLTGNGFIIAKTAELQLESEKVEKPDSEKPNSASILKTILIPLLLEKIETYNGSFYAVGSYWDGDDQSERFINDGIWESGDETFEEVVNQVKKDDVLILKSTYVGKGAGQFRVKYLGKVVSNPRNGVRLQVRWIVPINNIDITGSLTTFRSRISFLERSYFIELIEHLEGKSVEEINSSKLLEPSEDIIPTENTDNKLYRTAICNDFGETDTLNFSRDTKSLAALIALKEMKPPLAIALFGKWGSGKSFFMKMLEKHIKELSENQGFQESTTVETTDTKPEEELFHRGIAHIRFNAWSYMDANLWAGLSHSLFEKLNEYITDNTKGTVEKLKVQVKITKRLDILHSDLNHFKEKRSQLIHLKERLEKERESKILNYFKANNYDVAVSGFLKKNGYSDQQIKEMTPSSIKKVIDETIDLFSFFKSKGYQRSFITLSIIVLLFVIEGIVERRFAAKVDFLKDAWFKIITIFIPLVSTALTFFNGKLKAVKKVQEYLELINPKNQQSKEEIELIALHQELTEIDALTEEIQTSITTEYSKASDLTQLAIANFISVKPEQDDYRKHLGIVTTIRKDFETLSELFGDLTKIPQTDSNKVLNPSEESKQADLEQDKKIISRSFDDHKRLERIVLYIDDLDRCSDEKIMDVLEAVHLLMAFPLFIVVVGVDERSVHNALMNRRLERYRGIEKAIVDEHIEPVEPHEYLEKIFQIPFQLPEAKSEHIFAFIDSLVPLANVLETQEIFIEKSQSKNYTFEDGDDSLIASEPMEIAYDSAENKEPSDIVEELIPEKKPNVVYIAPNDIVITPTEKQLLIDLAPLVGNNPRSLKRYINIFRISKVYSHYRSSTSDRTKEIIFTIALLTGDFDDIAGEWYESNIVPITSFGKENEKFQIGLAEITSKESPQYHELLEAPAFRFSNELAFIKRFSYGSQLTKKR